MDGHPFCVQILASVLEKIVVHNDQVPLVPNQLTLFHSALTPSVSVTSYLNRIIRYSPSSVDSLIIAMIYIDRIVQCASQLRLCSRSIHRMLITSIMVASKFYDDGFYTNSYYAKVGGLSTSEINTLEINFLFLLRFTLSVTPDDYYTYMYQLARNRDPSPLPSPPTIVMHIPTMSSSASPPLPTPLDNYVPSSGTITVPQPQTSPYSSTLPQSPLFNNNTQIIPPLSFVQLLPPSQSSYPHVVVPAPYLQATHNIKAASHAPIAPTLFYYPCAYPDGSMQYPAYAPQPAPPQAMYPNQQQTQAFIPVYPTYSAPIPQHIYAYPVPIPTGAVYHSDVAWEGYGLPDEADKNDYDYDYEEGEGEGEEDEDEDVYEDDDDDEDYDNQLECDQEPGVYVVGAVCSGSVAHQPTSGTNNVEPAREGVWC
eukprot:TRINITY_DN4339_c0_g1_i1.p1 TRINITY_DN4339_c0_g1~~TRINITY_DN4339_c0_g1_i1.p1  ORF type:complete len:425 (-),score=90.10 TRINITY_DN4339_c0_g1_i1:153-1427(-)